MTPRKILIVDDDAKISRLIRTILERADFEVREENRPFAALATVREYRPDLLLLDVDMPGQDGGQVAAQVSDDPELSATPIIFVTSLVKSAEAGVRGRRRYLPKPCEPRVLIAAIEEEIGPRAA